MDLLCRPRCGGRCNSGDAGAISQPHRARVRAGSQHRARARRLLSDQLEFCVLPGHPDLPQPRSRQLGTDWQRHRPARSIRFFRPRDRARDICADPALARWLVLHHRHLRGMRFQFLDARPQSRGSLVGSHLAAIDRRRGPGSLRRRRRQGLGREQWSAARTAGVPQGIAPSGCRRSTSRRGKCAARAPYSSMAESTLRSTRFGSKGRT